MTNKEIKIMNPKIKYPNGDAHYDKNNNLIPHYDEKYCILSKTIGNDTIQVVEKSFDYKLIINDTCNTIENSDLGRVIHDIMDYKDTDQLINKINSYAKRWIKEVKRSEDHQIHTIDTARRNTVIYDNADAFIRSIKNDLDMFYCDYPYHELQSITVYEHNQHYYKLVLFLDDCDIEQHMDYIVHKRNIKEVIKAIKQHIGVSIINETKDILIKEI